MALSLQGVAIREGLIPVTRDINHQSTISDHRNKFKVLLKMEQADT